MAKKSLKLDGSIHFVKEIKPTYKRTNICVEKINSSSKSVEILRKIFDENTIDFQENFFVLFLDRGNKIVNFCHLSKGGVSGTVVDVRHLLSNAINTNASSVILSHNHPSGQLHPSENDKSITRKIREALRFFDVSLLDHIIITNDSYFSFADEGVL